MAILDVGQNFEKLDIILEAYSNYLDGFEQHLSLSGKNLESANKEQVAWLSYYDQLRIELHTLLKALEIRQDRVKGKLWKSYTEKSSIVLSDRAKEQYINQEEAYLEVLEKQLIVKELYDKYQSVVNSFGVRSYMLNNITKLRVAALDDAAI